MDAERKLLAKDWKLMYCREKEKNFRLERDENKRAAELDEATRRGSCAMTELENLVKRILSAKSLAKLQKELRERLE